MRVSQMKRVNLAQLVPGFETRQNVRERRAKLLRQLKAGEKPAKRVARRLQKCRNAALCGSPICPRCVRQLRKSFVTAALDCIDNVRNKHRLITIPITAFSAILTEEQYSPGDLADADLHQINERLQRRHQRCKFPLVFAGVDLSFNTDSNGLEKPYWQFQVYGIVVGVDPDDTKAALAHLYPKTQNTPRPLRVKKCDDLAKALSYMIKPYFSERVNYRDTTGRMNINTVRLKSDQIRELAPWLCQYPLPERYVLSGARRYSDRIEANKTTLQQLAQIN
jgi:hypothetical protein